MIYNVRFIGHHPNRFKCADVLEYTTERHTDIVHIFLDSHESIIRVTIPAVVGAAKVIDIIDRFDYVCRNSTAPFARNDGKLSEGADELEKRVKLMASAMARIAARWPHCVIPPSNPRSFLDPECPCSFFGVS